MDLNDDVYTQLTSETRDRILHSLSIRADFPPENLADFQLGSTSQADLEACLETLAVLADESAATLVKAALSGLSDGAVDFARYPSTLERAADLWVRDKVQAQQTFRWWHANIEVRKQNFVAAYSIPGRAPPVELDKKGEDRLRTLIAGALGESLQARDIRFFQISKRPSPWPGSEADQVIQIDIKRSSEPERVEIDDEGVILAKSLRFIVPVLVVIDPVRRALYVMSRKNPRSLRQAIAMAVMQVYFERFGEPQQLPKLHVHVGKLAREPRFQFPKGTRILAADVVRLDYRNLNEPGVRRSVVAEDGGVNLYGLADLSREDSAAVVHEATVRFALSDPRHDSRTRSCTLKQPNYMSFPHFSAGDRAAAEEFLVQNGLIDPDPFKGQVGPFDVLAGLTGDAHSWRLKDALGDDWIAALTKIGVLANGPAADNAHCNQCDRFYPVEVDVDSGLQVVTCPEHMRGVSPADVETSRFLPDRLAAWLAQQYATGTTRPSQVQSGVWDLGIIPGGGKRGAIPLVLATAAPSDAALVRLSDRIASRASGSPGLVISLSSSLLELKLRHGWKVTSLAGLVEIKDGTMWAPSEGPRILITGKKPRRKMPDRWPELFAKYQEIRQTGLGHYPAADKLLELHEWPWQREQIARKLKTEFPEDFS